MSEKDNIKTFAFVDIETTGLPEYNFGKVRITEIAIHTCSVHHFCSPLPETPPRALSKLVLYFNPGMRIDDEASKITGLNNEILSDQEKFDVHSAKAINQFFQHQGEQICLIAHNGNNFDFPIIKKTFEMVKMSLPPDILCADSREIITAIDEELEPKIKQVQPDAPESSEECFTAKVDSDDELCENALIDFEKNVKTPIDWQKLNETTPKRTIGPFNNRKRGAPEKCSHRGPNNKTRRELFPPKKTSYSLIAIYKRIFGKEPNTSHLAESDIITLREVAHYYGERFLRMANEYAKPFSEIKTTGLK